MDFVALAKVLDDVGQKVKRKKRDHIAKHESSTAQRERGRQNGMRRRSSSLRRVT